MLGTAIFKLGYRTLLLVCEWALLPLPNPPLQGLLCMHLKQGLLDAYTLGRSAMSPRHGNGMKQVVYVGSHSEGSCE